MRRGEGLRGRIDGSSFGGVMLRNGKMEIGRTIELCKDGSGIIGGW